jgi:hypothetical protein
VAERLRLELRLLEQLREPRAPLELPPRGRIQILGAELREGLQLAVLGEVEPQRAGDGLHRLRLRVAAHARDGDADVCGRPLPGVEQVELEEDLTVRNRDDVRRDVCRDVAGLRLDDR